LSKETGVKLTLDKVISDELADYHRGQAAWLDDGKAADEIDYAAANPDLAIWEGSRCLAVIKVDPEGGEPAVVRFDGPGEWSVPELKARPRFRTFTVFQATGDPESCEPDRFCGHGMDLEKVIAWEENIVRVSLESDNVSKPGFMGEAEKKAYCLELPDLVVIEDRRVVAVLRAGSDGSYSVVNVSAGFGG
jgi:hypothetical protein